MSNKYSKEKSPQQPLKMKIAGGLIKHLGLQMYSGPVPSIAELVANAWDAMASRVDVMLPVGRPISSSDEITIKDNGHGMTYEECNEYYLLVGRDKRKEEGDRTKSYDGVKSRRLLGRKGIGKLAGFGIANVVEIKTIKNGEITHFEMDFEKMTKGGYVRTAGKEYEPKILGENGKKTIERPGTMIILKKLKLMRCINEEEFKASLTRRFALLSDPEFSVFINENKIQRIELEFQFRFPKSQSSWKTEKVKNVGKIKWWAGFTEIPIKNDEARGIVVFARGKLAQNPWFFDFSGGTYGQHGMQYMTGEVQADFLDDTDGEDLIATDRASVLWDEDKKAIALKEWGQLKVRELLKEWADDRTKERKAKPEIKKYLAYGEKLPDREKQIFHQYVEKLVSIPQIDDENLLDELVQFGFNALTNRHFLDVIKQINSATPSDRQKIVDILSEWDIVEAINAAQQVRGRVEVIKKFEEMIDKGVPEKPDMQDYVMQHPWLINPVWAPLHHEKSLDNVLIKQFKVKKTKTKGGKQRLDFFCLAGSGQWEVVDLKRPGKVVGIKELQQLQGYVTFLKEHAKKTSHPDLTVSSINGILIFSDIANDTASLRDDLQKAGIYVIDWRSLLRRTKSLHEEFLNTVKSRAPADDPRIKGLEEIGQKPRASMRRKKK